MCPAERGGGVHQEVALHLVVVDVPKCLVHHPVRVHPQDVSHPLKAAGSHPPEDVKGPGCRACLLVRGPIRDPRHHPAVCAVEHGARAGVQVPRLASVRQSRADPGFI